ncbi:hypothetical protein MSIMFI_05548 [Mycobacterium simulans]|nr:hypothetical protein MSIMFI_05548 [Mycobacterium simulans]
MALVGARYESVSPYWGAGRAWVSSLSLTVNGRASRATTAAGTMYCGNLLASAGRMSAGLAVPVK